MYRITAEMIPDKEILSCRDMYIPYKNTRLLNEESFVEKKIFFSILSDYLKFLKNKIIEGTKVELLRIGWLAVTGKEQIIEFDEQDRPKLPPDWGTTRKLWKEKAEAKNQTFEEFCRTASKEEKTIIFHFNEHTDYVRYKVEWNQENTPDLKHKELYSFRITKDFKTELAKKIKSGKEYFVRPNKVKSQNLL